MNAYTNVELGLVIQRITFLTINDEINKILCLALPSVAWLLHNGLMISVNIHKSDNCYVTVMIL